MKVNPVIRGGFPFTYNPNDTLLTLGEGAYVYDRNQRKYIDLCSGLWNMPFGYSNEYIIGKIKNQIDKLPFSNLLTLVADVQEFYANRLTEYMGDFLAVLYTCSGSEAIEAAIKSCRKYQSLNGRSKRKIIAAFTLSYHGTSYGAMSISGIDQILIDDYQPILPQIQWIDVPRQQTDIQEWKRIIDDFFLQNSDLLAGVIAEPVFASGGVVPIPVDVLKYLQHLCNKHDVLFVLDEVASGFGRLGFPFAYMKYELEPDLVCLSKAITNGYVPLGVLAFSSRIAHFFVEKDAVIEHFSTQGGNLIAIAAANAMLDLMKEYDKYNVSAKGEFFCECLKEALADKKYITIRGLGLMIAIDLPTLTTGERLLTIIGALQKRGLLVYPYNNPGYNCGINISPPYILTLEEIKKYAHIIALNIRRFI